MHGAGDRVAEFDFIIGHTVAARIEQSASWHLFGAAL